MGDKIPVDIKKCFPIDEERLKIYQEEEPSLKTGFVFCGQATNGYGELEEHILQLNKDDEIVAVQRSDKILMEEFPITKMVEYRFSADDTWKVSKIGADALD